MQKLIKRLKRGPSAKEWMTFALGAVAALLVAQTIITIKKDVMTPLQPESSTVTIAWLPPSVKKWHQTRARLCYTSYFWKTRLRENL
jgi:hypothetical protein